MRSRIVPIARKEFLHVVRDWRTMLMAVGMPLMMVLLFGYAITLDIKNLRLAVSDEDRSPASRRLIDAFTGSGYFRRISDVAGQDQIARSLDAGIAQAVLIIPRDFSRRIEEGGAAAVQLLVDGAESNTATIAGGYMQKIMLEHSVEIAVERLARSGVSAGAGKMPVEVRSRFWYNPELRSQSFVIPGLISTIMMVMTALLTSLTIIGERERGSLEQLIATPVRPYEIMIGKLIPYFVIGVGDAFIIAIAGVLVFDMPFVGSLWLFLLATAVFAAAGLGIGLRISIAASSQVMAMQMAVLATMLPSFLLSGFMFAIKNMPGWLQVATYLIPARYHLQILRGVLLKGAGMDMELIWKPFVVLLVLALIFIAGCVRTFKKKIG